MARFQKVMAAILISVLCLNSNIHQAASQDTQTAPTAPIRVGSKEFTEQLLLGKMIVLLLRNAGFEVEDKTGMGGSPIVRAALESGELDIYPEYTGTSLALHHGLPREALPNDEARVFALAKQLDGAKGFVWLERAQFNNTYTLMVRQTLANEGIQSLLDLADYMNAHDAPFTICVESEFYGREQDGLQTLQAHYGFAFKEENVLLMDLNAIYESLKQGQCDIGEGYATDGRIDAWGFVNLQDTLSFFPIYNPAPVVRQELLTRYPEIADILSAFGSHLDTATMSALNARVDLGPDGILANGDEETVDQVAHAFLQQLGLLKAPTIVVSSKEFTENLLLGKMIVLLLQDAGYEVEDKTALGGSTAVRLALERGEIDIYPEYTGTGSTLHNGLPVTALPTDAQRAYTLAKSLDERKGLVWLNPTKLNDTYTLMVRKELADQGIKSIEDLADFMNENDSPYKICVESEFFGRPQDGLPGLLALYGFTFKQENILFMELNEIYDNLREGACDVGEGFSTDGRIAAWGFVNLEDTLAFFPFYNAAPVIRKDLLASDPRIATVLATFGDLLDDTTIAQLNARVDLGADGILNNGDEESVDDVAYSFLRSYRLLKPPKITVASENSTEQQILGKMLALLLQDAGYDVLDKVGLGDAQLVRSALVNGEADVYVALTGAALSVHNGLPVSALPADPERSYALAKALDEKRNLLWLERGQFNSTTALLVGKDLWEQGIKTIDDLAKFMNENGAPFSFCVDADFLGSESDGLPALQARYGFEFKPENVLLMEQEDAYSTLRTEGCDVALGARTDGRSAAWGFFALEDTQAFFPFYNPAPVVRKAVADPNPELINLLNQLAPLLDDTLMSQLNARVDLGADGEFESGDEESPETVARSFLESAGLIKPVNGETTTDASEPENSGADAKETDPVETPPVSPDPKFSETNPKLTDSTSAQTEVGKTPGTEHAELIIGSGTPPEQLLLGQLFVLLLKDAGYPVLDRTGVGTPADLRNALETGEIDLYPEFMHTALTLFHGIPATALPNDVERAYTLVRDLDRPSDLVWLRKLSFDNAYALVVRQGRFSQEITSIDTLATFMNENGAPLKLCLENDFLEQTESGLAALEERYAFQFQPQNLVRIDSNQLYQGLIDGVCDVSIGPGADGRIEAWSLTVLTDTLNFFSNQTPAPIVRASILNKYPEIAKPLEQLAAVLDISAMRRLQAQIMLGADGAPDSGDEQEVKNVAAAFLCEQELLSGCPIIVNTDTASPDATVPQMPTPSSLAAPITTTLTTLDVTTSEISFSAPVSVTGEVAPVTTGNVLTTTVTTPETFGVNARAAATTNAPIAQVLPRGSTLLAIGRTGDSTWLQVVLADGQLAWVFTQAVIVQPETIQRLPITTPPEPRER